jgi:hypothetical protein
MNIEIKKCVSEIIDKLYENTGFYNWWDYEDVDTENEIIKQLEEIVKKRFEKYGNSTKL